MSKVEKSFKKMNAFVKKGWVKALRSGEYKKGKGSLCDLNKCEYCCLGVLTDIYNKNHKLTKEEKLYFLNLGFLDEDVAKAYGIDNEVQEFLAAKNDGANKKRSWPFHEIANWIEANI